MSANFSAADPGAGEPYGIRYLARLRTNKAESMRTSIAALIRAREQPSAGEWTAQSRTAFVNRTDTIIVDLNLLATGLDQVAFALNRYAAQVEQIKATQVGLTAQRRSAAESIEHGLRLIELLDNSPRYTFGSTRKIAGAIRTDERDTSETRISRASLWRHVDEDAASLRNADRRFDDLLTDRRRADALCISTMEDKTVTGGTWSTTPSQINGLSDAALLNHLTGLTTTDLTIMLTLHPELALRLAAVADATAVAAWWRSLGNPTDRYDQTDAQRALIELAPDAIGNLEGVAYWARSAANVIRLDAAIAALQGNNSDVSNSLRAIYKALKNSTHEIPKLLISLHMEPGREALAAIAVGDLDAAHYVTFQVSGMNSSTLGMVGTVGSALALYDAEKNLESHLLSGGGFAVVAWIGYRSPDTSSVAFETHATLGARALTKALEGYRAATGGNESGTHLTVEAHSYGSTVAMKALTSNAANVNALALYGSAGAPEEVTAMDDLQLDPGQVWVGQTSDDWVAELGQNIGRRDDPAILGGVSLFDTDGGVSDPLTGEFLETSHGHDEYLKSKSESLRNLAAIALGYGHLVTADD
jgi:hypothetical protein